MRRVLPSQIFESQDNYLIHLARYMFAARQLSPDSKVLEIGCGSGYGARLLSDFSSEVDAYDISSSELKLEWDYFQEKDNLFFYDTLPEKKYDFIVSFEVIEHIDNSNIEEYFKNIKTRLVDGGYASYQLRELFRIKKGLKIGKNNMCMNTLLKNLKRLLVSTLLMCFYFLKMIQLFLLRTLRWPGI
jgi:SAM-dependent methyltransferase